MEKGVLLLFTKGLVLKAGFWGMKEGTIQNLMLPCLENEVNSVDDRGVES
jgi:hypothetical protein